ncbi:family 43 glycosylhydrolase [Paenibacillus sp. GCM10023250]|uniref:family 43 glycosylhydrolase n=1 Tax=Paenibacillus sp. GCM10023250 TaxID=3252648 RepID=UPI0036092452
MRRSEDGPCLEDGDGRRPEGEAVPSRERGDERRPEGEAVLSRGGRDGRHPEGGATRSWKRADIQIRDPFVMPVEAEGVYYLYGSTDPDIWGPGTGFDAYVSRNLDDWEGPFPVFRPPADFFSDTNFWAPEVYAREGRFYMFATFRRKDNGRLGTAALAADGPLGPFLPHSAGPVTPEAWSSLDGSLFVDEAGSPWMVFCHEWQQIGDGEVCAVRLTADLREAAGEP